MLIRLFASAIPTPASDEFGPGAPNSRSPGAVQQNYQNDQSGAAGQYGSPAPSGPQDNGWAPVPDTRAAESAPGRI